MAQERLHYGDWIVIAAYFVSVILVGILVSDIVVLCLFEFVYLMGLRTALI